MRWIGCLALGALVACGDEEAKPQAEDTAVIPEGSNPGDCSDGEDNDGDGLVDCDDDGCAGASACDEPEPEDTGEEPPWPITIDLKPELADYIDVSILPEDADLGCMETSWVEDEFSTSLQGVSEHTATVYEVLTGASIPAARIEVFEGNDPNGELAGEPVYGESTGDWLGDLPTCTPTAMRYYSDPIIGRTLPTVVMHSVIGAGVGSHEFRVVGRETHIQMSPLLAGAPSADKGILFGQVIDCAGNPLRGAQIVLVDGEGMPLLGQQRFYSDANAPSADKFYTTNDGWWFVGEVPTGDWTVSVWVNDADLGHIQVAEVPTVSMLDTNTVSPVTVWTRSDAHVGHTDGIVYPDSCSE